MVVLVAFVLTGCAPPGVRACLDGDRLTRQGKYAQAIEKLKVASALLPRDARVWNLLGLAYHQNGQFENAFASYQSAEARDPNFAAVHYNLGCLFYDQNQFKNAVTELSHFTKLEPNQHYGWLKLAVAHLRMKEFNEAGQCYLNAARLKSDSARAMNDLGVVEVQRRRPREALGYFGAALKRNPSYPPALLNLAIVNHRYFTNYPLALRGYREFLKTHPEPASSAAVNQVVAKLEQLLAPPPVIVVTNAPPATVSMSASPGEETNAVPDKAEIVSRADPKTLSPSSNKVEAILVPEPVESDVVPDQRTNVVEVAAAAAIPITNSPPAEVGVASVPDSAPSNVPVESIRIEEDVPPPVVADTSPSQEQPPAQIENGIAESNPTALNSVVPEPKRPLILPVRPRESKWRIPDRLNPGAWFRKDSQSEAPPTVEDESPEAVRNVNAPTTSEDRLREAPAGAESATQVPTRRVIQVPSYRYRIPVPPPSGDRSAAEVHFANGLRAHRERRLTEAIEAYRQAVSADPSYFEAYYNIGLAAYDLRDTAESLVAYEIALSLKPDSADARYNFALALRRGGYLGDAAHELERLLIDRSNSVPAHLALAKLYADELFQTELARRHYKRVLELSPQHPQATEIRYWLAGHP